MTLVLKMHHVISNTSMLNIVLIIQLFIAVILQMVGRAGRPQFDTEGVAVIMTQKQVSLTFLAG